MWQALGLPKMNEQEREGNMVDTLLTHETDQWEQDQKYCDIADVILKILVEKKLTVKDSRCVLDKVQKGVDASVQSTIWGAPLVCSVAPSKNFKFLHSPEQITAEIERRKGQGEIRNP